MSDTPALPEPSAAQVVAWMKEAGWQNSALLQADFYNVVRVVRAALAAQAEAHAAEVSALRRSNAAAKTVIAGMDAMAMAHEIARLRGAVAWALGTNGEFRTQGTMDGQYGWRGELSERAGLRWDGKKWVSLRPNVRVDLETTA